MTVEDANFETARPANRAGVAIPTGTGVGVGATVGATVADGVLVIGRAAGFDAPLLYAIRRAGGMAFSAATPREAVKLLKADRATRLKGAAIDAATLGETVSETLTELAAALAGAPVALFRPLGLGEREFATMVGMGRLMNVTDFCDMPLVRPDLDRLAVRWRTGQIPPCNMTPEQVARWTSGES